MALKFNNIFIWLLLFILPAVNATPKLPDNITWLTNNEDPVYASPDAIKGGTLKTWIASFPLTLRTVGPDSNGSFRSNLSGNQMQLVVVHPNTGKLIPGLATHWAYSNDNKTMYFKLNPKARWSDGVPVTAHDFAFTFEFMRSKEIVDPWHANFFKDELDKATVYDDLTFSVTTVKPRPREELHDHTSEDMRPIPRHFYKDMKGFVRKYNWKVPPNTGAYKITQVKKGKSITFSRKKDWWAKDLKYNKNRFNIDKVKFTVIRDRNLAWEHFKKGKLDVFDTTLPLYWHEKATGKIFDKGYVHKLWFYTDSPQASYGLWLNQDNEILKDLNVRLGIAYSFNIKKVNDQVLRGDYEIKQSISTGFGGFTNKTIHAREFDLDTANDYFNKAGWGKRGSDGIRIKDGKRLSLSITYGTEIYTPRLVVIKEEFKRAGFELKLRKMDSAASFKSILEKKHDIWWGALVGGSYPQYWSQFHSDNAHIPQTNNFTNTDDPEMDRLVDIFRASTNYEERTQTAHKIQQLIHDQSAWIARLDTPYIRNAYWRWIKLPEVPGTRLIGNRAPYVFDYNGAFEVSDGGQLWIDKKLKKETLKAKKQGKSFPAVTRIDKTFKVEN